MPEGGGGVILGHRPEEEDIAAGKRIEWLWVRAMTVDRSGKIESPRSRARRARRPVIDIQLDLAVW
jgi:hypothetical protein